MVSGPATQAGRQAAWSRIPTVLALLACALFPTGIAAQGALRGAVYHIWTDPIDGGRPMVTHTLITSSGDAWTLQAATGRTALLDGIRHGQRVRVTGRVAQAAAGGHAPRFQVNTVSPLAAGLASPPPTSLRYQLLRCDAAGGDAPGMSDDELRARFDGDALSLRNWLSEMSEGKFTLEIAGLQHVALPQPISAYGGTVNNWGYTGALQEDCILGATGVDWSSIDGVFLHPNWGNGAAFGGMTAILFPSGFLPLRILTVAGNIQARSVYAHELGHSLGWSHSGRDFGPPTQQQYDNPWDVMSGGGYVQTITANRAAFDWIPAERRTAVQPGMIREAILEIVGSGRTGPRADGSLDMLELLAPGGTRHLTVEPRIARGTYAEPFIQSGVLLHRLTRPLDQSHACCLAKLVDINPLGVPGDDGAVFEVGESYEHPDGIGVEVLDALPDGYRVRAWSGWWLDLTVQGAGAITGVPSAPACGTACRTLHAPSVGTITLTATPTGSAPFRNWTGACTGGGTCSVAMNRHHAVTAWFGTMPLHEGARVRPYAIVGLPHADSLAINTVDNAPFTVTATGLPPGLALAPTTGRITGTATTEGSATVALTIVSAGGTTRDTVTMHVLRPGATVGDSLFVVRGVAAWFPVPITTTGPIGRDPQVTAGALPPGFTIREDGALGGTTNDHGTYPFRLRYQLATGPVEQDHHLVVLEQAPAIVPPPGLASLWVGQSVSTSLRLVSPMPVEWSVVAGALPPGLTLSASGTLSGRPTTGGNYPFTLEARRGTVTARHQVTSSVVAPSIAEELLVGDFMRGNSLPPPQADYLDFLGNRNGRVDVGDIRAFLQSRGKAGGGGAP